MPDPTAPRLTHPEVHAQRADWGAAPSADPVRLHAMAALEALAETGEPDSDPGGAADTPPLPDHLRTRWEESYGRSASALPAKPAAGSWSKALADWWQRSTASLAWGGGLAAAALVAVLLLVNQPREENALSHGVVTRSGGTVESSPGIVPIYLIAAGDPAKTEAILTQLRAAFPSRPVSVVPSRGEVPAGPSVILESEAAFLADPDAAVSAVESADEARAAGQS